MISTIITPSPGKILIVVTLVSFPTSKVTFAIHYWWFQVNYNLHMICQLPYAFYLGLVIHEAHILLGLGVSRCRICIVSDTKTYDYIDLCHFLKLLSVSTSPCHVRVWVCTSYTTIYVHDLTVASEYGHHWNLF